MRLSAFRLPFSSSYILERAQSADRDGAGSHRPRHLTKIGAESEDASSLSLQLEQQLGCRCIARTLPYAVIAGHSRSKTGVALLAYDPAIHGAIRRSLMDVIALGASAWTTGSSPVVTKRGDAGQDEEGAPPFVACALPC
jgi:hypothetical protein